MLRSLLAAPVADARVLVGPETADDAGVFRLADTGLVATVDFITPVCDDAYRFGRVAAANSLSDVFAMGGEVLFALNIACFPDDKAPAAVLASILEGAAYAVGEAGGVVLGGHSVRDAELKFGLAVIGRVDPDRVLANSGAHPGQRMILTKRLGSGVMLNAFRAGKIGEAALEPVLASMERLNAAAARRALQHGATACTDITGFGLVNHALGVARASRVGVRVEFNRLAAFDGFHEMAAAGITTRGTRKNREAGAAAFEDEAGLTDVQRDLLFDPQTSGGLLIFTPPREAGRLVDALRDGGDPAVDIGEAIAGSPRFVAA